jgi:hypothetical protein
MDRTPTRAPGGPAATVPDATRAHRAGWRDPRLWIGLAVVAACVLVGARVMATADDTVHVGTTARAAAAGTTLQPGDLELRRVRFADPEVVDRDLTGSSVPSRGITVSRDVGAGELLPRAAVTESSAAELVQVPLSVASDDLPATARRGVVVDVWVAPADRQRAPARLVLDDVTVVAVPDSSGGLAPRSTRQVIVGVPAEEGDRLGEAIGALSSGRVVLTVAGR